MPSLSRACTPMLGAHTAQRVKAMNVMKGDKRHMQTKDCRRSPAAGNADSLCICSARMCLRILRNFLRIRL